MEKPLVDKEYLLEKYPGKGGWTYTIIPEVLPDKHTPFGWVKVKGSIDGYEIKNYNLQPTEKGDNRLFLAVKAEIRKAIKKEAGDYVHVILYRDNSPLEIPEELIIPFPTLEYGFTSMFLVSPAIIWNVTLSKTFISTTHLL